MQGRVHSTGLRKALLQISESILIITASPCCCCFLPLHLQWRTETGDRAAEPKAWIFEVLEQQAAVLALL